VEPACGIQVVQSTQSSRSSRAPLAMIALCFETARWSRHLAAFLRQDDVAPRLSISIFAIACSAFYGTALEPIRCWGSDRSYEDPAIGDLLCFLCGWCDRCRSGRHLVAGRHVLSVVWALLMDLGMFGMGPRLCAAVLHRRARVSGQNFSTVGDVLAGCPARSIAASGFYRSWPAPIHGYAFGLF